jgi:hypothetical protein
MPETLIVNFARQAERELLWSKLRMLVGTWRLELTQYRPRRTDRQNRYYWPAFVAPFGNFLRGCDLEVAGSLITDLKAHEILKFKFLRETAFHPLTGELIGDLTRSSTGLSIPEFNDYLDRCGAYLLTEFDIEVPQPRVYREREDPREKEQAATGAA